MHPIVVILHQATSFAILGLFLFALWRSFSGLIGRGGWLPADDKARRFLPIALDIQFVLGIIVWLTLESSVASAFGPAPPEGQLFKSVIHPLAGIVVVALAHIGSVKTRKLKDPREKFRTMGLFYAIGFLIVIAQSPFHH